MIDREMAAAALRMLQNHHFESDDVTVVFEFSTICNQPELKFYYFDDEGNISLVEYFADHYLPNSDHDYFHYGSFKEGCWKLEGLIYG